MSSAEAIAGMVLAGGRSSRMAGQDKAFVQVAGLSLLERAVLKLEPQVALVAINSNLDPALMAPTKLPILADTIKGFAGPMAGILAGLEWAEENNAQYLATVACDTPFFPRDLVARLAAAPLVRDSIALAASAGRIHPVFGLWPVRLTDVMRDYIGADPRRSVLGFAEHHRHAIVEFPLSAGDVDPFFNVNTPQDLAEAERLARKFNQ